MGHRLWFPATTTRMASRWPYRNFGGPAGSADDATLLRKNPKEAHAGNLGGNGRLCEARGNESEDRPMAKIVYRIVKHDDGWAYKGRGTFSESFRPTKPHLPPPRPPPPAEVPGETVGIEYETADGVGMKSSTPAATGRRPQSRTTKSDARPVGVGGRTACSGAGRRWPAPAAPMRGSAMSRWRSSTLGGSNRSRACPSARKRGFMSARRVSRRSRGFKIPRSATRSVSAGTRLTRRDQLSFTLDIPSADRDAVAQAAEKNLDLRGRPARQSRPGQWPGTL